MLAERLEVIMTKIINHDQTGFIKNRYSFHNIRWLLNVMHSPTSAGTLEFVILIDAEKAFVFCSFISWIKFLYASQLARVRTNNDCSEYFQPSPWNPSGLCTFPPFVCYCYRAFGCSH